MPIFLLFFVYASGFGKDEVFKKTYPTEPGKPVVIDFRDVDGDVQLSLPREMGFRLRAMAHDGLIRSDARFDRISVQKRHRLEAERGQTGALIVTETGDGDITIHEF